MAESGPTCITGHQASIFERGGKKRVDNLVDLSKAQWARERDNTSEGSIDLSADSCSAQADKLAKLRTHRHELVLYRGSYRAWEGPIHRITTNDDGSAQIVARDVSEYLFSIPLSKIWDNSTAGSGATEVTTRMQQILTYELNTAHDVFYPSDIPGAAEAVDAWLASGGTVTPVTGGWTVHIPAWESDAIWPDLNILPYLDIRHFPNEARTSTKTLAYQMTVGEHLQYLARQSGIDFTVVGRRIVIWDVSRPLGRLTTMTDANFGSTVIVTEYGADHTQLAYVTGSDGSYGESLNLENLAYYGPWTTMYTAYQDEGAATPTQTELKSQSRRNLSGRSPAPIEVRIPDNSTILLERGLSIDKLVPGVQIPLLATLNARPISQMQRIDSVTVTETPDGESIQVTLTPATKPDSDVTEG